MVLRIRQVGDGVTVGFLHEWTIPRRDFQDSEDASKLRWLRVSCTCLQNATGQRCDERDGVFHVRLEVGGGDVFTRIQPAVRKFHLFRGVEALPAKGNTGEVKGCGGGGRGCEFDDWIKTVHQCSRKQLESFF